MSGWRGDGSGGVARSTRRAVLASMGGLGLAGITGQLGAAASRIRPVVAPALTNLQSAGQRVISSYSGLMPPQSLFDDITAGQTAGVIFFGENISSDAQIAGVITQLRQAQAQSSIQVPLLLMTDQEGGWYAGCPAHPPCRRSRSDSPAIPSAPPPPPGPARVRTSPGWA
jgi:beta-N-acetylhexosaminidase